MEPYLSLSIFFGTFIILIIYGIVSFIRESKEQKRLDEEILDMQDEK